MGTVHSAPPPIAGARKISIDVREQSGSSRGCRALRQTVQGGPCPGHDKRAGKTHAVRNQFGTLRFVLMEAFP